MGPRVQRRAVELLLGRARPPALLDEEIGRVGDDPLAVASALCDWANEQGGHDNVTVALAHLTPTPPTATPTPPTATPTPTTEHAA